MRNYVVPAFLALLLVAPGAAFAATATSTVAASATGEQTISGTIKDINLIARNLTLADGSRYYLPLNFTDPGLKAGEKVTVHWKMNGTAHDVTSVTIG